MDACRYDGIWKICLKVHTITQKTHARTQALDRKYKHLDYMMASPSSSSSSPSSSHHEHYRQLLFGGGFGISPPFMLLGPCTFYCPPTLPLYLAKLNHPHCHQHSTILIDRNTFLGPSIKRDMWHFERCDTPNASHAISRCHFRLIRRQILVISQNFPIPKSFS